VTNEEHSDRQNVEEDLLEDLEVDKDLGTVSGGGTKFEITQDVTTAQRVVHAPMPVTWPGIKK
jgi:hypothetical protein